MQGGQLESPTSTSEDLANFDPPVQMEFACSVHHLIVPTFSPAQDWFSPTTIHCLFQNRINLDLTSHVWPIKREHFSFLVHTIL